MNIKHQYWASQSAKKMALMVVTALTLSACSSTANNTDSHQTTNSYPQNNQALTQCHDNAEKMANHAETSASTAQYLAAANAMNYCLSNHTQSIASESTQVQQERMKILAASTLNFIKAGDIISANKVVQHFKQRYPNKDLYFSDYTSFLDTATALLNVNSMSPTQLSTLNISRTLRSEIERKDYWLSH